MRGSQRATRLRLTAARQRMRLAGSYERLPLFLELAPQMTYASALKLLGQEWSGFDNISAYSEALEEWLPETTAPLMMTPEERAALAELPDPVTVYRGADKGVNEDGLCWSIDKQIASAFPSFLRYRAANPVIVTATVKKIFVVALKLDRTESEIITRYPTITDVTDLPLVEIKI